MASVETSATSFYSSGGNAKYKGWFGASVTTTATTCQITIEQYAGMVNGYGYAVNVKSYYRNGTSGSWSSALSSSGTLSSHPGSTWAWFAKKTYTSTVGRTDSTQYIQYYVTASCPSAPYSGGRGPASSSTLTVTIPALDAKTVYYNLNYINADGSIPTPPSAQNASSSAAITLASAPSRTGFNFVNWNTKADGTGTNYAAGSTYTGANTMTLYAIWQQITGLPSIDSLQIYRASDSAGTHSSAGTHLYLTGYVSWGAQTTATEPTAGSVMVETRESGASSYGTAQAATVSGMSVTYTASGFAADKDYDVRITVTNGQGVSAVIEQPNAITHDGYIIEIDQNGKVSFGTDTDWAYLYGELANNNYVRWRCRLGVVYVECYFWNATAIGPSWTNTTYTMPAAYRPSHNVGTQMALWGTNNTIGVGYVFAMPDGHVQSYGTVTSNNIICSFSYPVE